MKPIVQMIARILISGENNKSMSDAISKGSLVRSRYGLSFQWKVIVMMILRIVILGAFLVGIMRLGEKNFADYGSGMLDLVYLLLYLCAYLVLLYFEIRSRLSKSASQKQMRWMGFHFTFWAAFLWLMIIVLNSPHYTFDNAFGDHRYNIYFLLNFSIVGGLVSGVIGTVVTQLMVLFVFKQPEQP
jgi:hypothetical protein